MVVVPNEWHGNWQGRGLRAKQPRYGGPSAFDYKAVSMGEARGTMLTYDAEFGGVLELPESCAALTLLKPDGTTAAPQLTNSLLSLLRKRGGGKASDLGVTERVLATADTSTNILLDKLMERLIWVLSRGGVEHIRGFAAFREVIRPVAAAVTRPGVTLGTLIAEGTFPFITPPIELVGDGLGASVAAAPAAARETTAAATPRGRGGWLNTFFGRGDGGQSNVSASTAALKIPTASDTPESGAPTRRVSFHLCACDTAHLGAGGTRDVLVWLTLVNLEYVNPATSMPDELLTPRGGALDSRVALVIPGDLSVASGARCKDDAVDGMAAAMPAGDAGAIAPAASADDQEDDADDDNLGI